MTTYRVKPTDKALVDAGEAYFWINEQSDGAALRWYEGLMEAFRSLEKNPLRCRLAPESVFFDEEIRQLVYGKYRVLFTVEGETVYVLRVRHGAREYLKPEDEEAGKSKDHLSGFMVWQGFSWVGEVRRVTCRTERSPS